MLVNRNDPSGVTVKESLASLGDLLAQIKRLDHQIWFGKFGDPDSFRFQAARARLYGLRQRAAELSSPFRLGDIIMPRDSTSLCRIVQLQAGHVQGRLFAQVYLCRKNGAARARSKRHWVDLEEVGWILIRRMGTQDL